MTTGRTPMAPDGPGLAFRTGGPTRPADELPADVDRAVVDAAAAADVLVVDRRRDGVRTAAPGHTEIAGRQVVVVPRRPGARPSVACYSRDAPGTDPAVERVRRTVVLDATAAAHYDVAAALAVAGGDGTGEAEGSFDDLLDDGADGDPATDDADRTRWTGDTRPADGGRSADAADASVSPSAAELSARRDSVDTATHRVLEGAPETAVPLAFCGLAGVVEPIADASP